jgi:hypothetical protein
MHFVAVSNVSENDLRQFVQDFQDDSVTPLMR